MSRSGYHDDCGDEWALIRYRGAVASAIRGKRGQAFLREMLAAMDALPEPRLIADHLVFDGAVRIGEVCAMGSVARARNLDVSKLDPHDAESVAGIMGIADALAREISWVNDEGGPWQGDETPEQRFIRVRQWIEARLR